ncbi:hypothetical protein M9H77_03522 [Catharanthus roseus]|uniref:Uncharacterized protein n=1 Tax=Catharanthus roseus TaxID=4058 RepID=A0ACC0CBG5_CATRO|nr:hypothetical protein M9H77_03522 [Catharanthus roseus]
MRLHHDKLKSCWSLFTKHKKRLQLPAPALSDGNLRNSNEAPSSPHIGLYQFLFLVFSVSIYKTRKSSTTLSYGDKRNNLSDGNEALSSPQHGIYQFIFQLPYCFLHRFLRSKPHANLLSHRSEVPKPPCMTVKALVSSMSSPAYLLWPAHIEQEGWLPEFFPAMKRTESDLNPCESEYEAVSNNLERETEATPPLRQGSPTNEGHSGQIHNIDSEIGE